MVSMIEAVLTELNLEQRSLTGRISAIEQAIQALKPRRGRTMSASARRRISQAQKERWARYHRKKK